jgi:hypothetical protein
MFGLDGLLAKRRTCESALDGSLVVLVNLSKVLVCAVQQACADELTISSTAEYVPATRNTRPSTKMMMLTMLVKIFFLLYHLPSRSNMNHITAGQ